MLRKLFLFLFLSSCLASADLLPESPAFWKTKEKVYKKIRDERAIIVSVQAKKNLDKVPLEPYILHLTGGGHMNVPVQFAYEKAKDLSNLKKVSSHIVESKYNANDQTLFLHTVAFGYHATLKMKMVFKNATESPAIEFDVIEGVFLGLKGRVVFGEIALTKTEVGYFAGYRYKNLPFPKFFVEFGLEVVMQKVAGLLRSHIESEYLGSKK